ncbi:MAG TPA: PIN domain-containing protein [Candidatus Sulfotelmatobacter sp.]
MKWFFDTSVLIPVFNVEHEHHEASLAAFVAANRENACCSAHSLAELYSVLTRLPGKHRVSGEQVLFFIEGIEEHLTIIALNSREYSSAIREAAAMGIVGGLLYDFLLARCARKASAEVIYTWDIQDFRRLGPEVASRIRTP